MINTKKAKMMSDVIGSMPAWRAFRCLKVVHRLAGKAENYSGITVPSTTVRLAHNVGFPARLR